MLELRTLPAFDRDVKSCKKKHRDLNALKYVMGLICEDTEESRHILTRDFRDHALRGNWSGARECHVADLGDWILIYAVRHDEGTAEFIATGTHDQFLKPHGNRGRWP